MVRLSSWGMHRKGGISNRRNKRIHYGMAERAARCRNDEQPHRTVRYRKRKGRGHCKSSGTNSGFMEQQRVFKGYSELIEFLR